MAPTPAILQALLKLMSMTSEGKNVRPVDSFARYAGTGRSRAAVCKAPIRSGLVEGQSERERNTQGAKPSGVYLVLHSARKRIRERCGSTAVRRQQAMVWPGGHGQK